MMAVPRRVRYRADINFALPPGYDQNSSAKYPVLYMHDGQNLFDPHLSYTGVPWGVDKAIARLSSEGKIRAAIVVGIWNTPKRFGEYMPQKAVSVTNTAQLPSIPIPTHDEIVSDNYLKFIVEELKPFIDAHYRTLPGRADTFIMGSSMGGLISAYAVAEYPKVFGGRLPFHSLANRRRCCGHIPQISFTRPQYTQVLFRPRHRHARRTICSLPRPDGRSHGGD